MPDIVHVGSLSHCHHLLGHLNISDKYAFPAMSRNVWCEKGLLLGF